MKTLINLILFLMASVVMAESRYQPTSASCKLNRIYDMTDETIELMAAHSDRRRLDRSGHDERINLRQEIVKNLQTIKGLAQTCMRQNEDHQNEPPTNRKTCQIYADDGTLHRYLYRTTNIDGDALISLGVGTQLEVLGDDVIYYKGQPKEGVKMRVLYGVPGHYEPAADRGTLIWYYKSTLKNYCR